ncbi:hypothetical protein LINPERPRIM_LOCUS44051 [Linum perenne]
MCIPSVTITSTVTANAMTSHDSRCDSHWNKLAIPHTSSADHTMKTCRGSRIMVMIAECVLQSLVRNLCSMVSYKKFERCSTVLSPVYVETNDIFAMNVFAPLHNPICCFWQFLH